MSRQGSTRQRGGSLIGVVLIIGVVIFIGGFLLKLIPAYMQHSTVSSIMQGMAEEDGLSQQSPGQLRRLLDRRLGVNGIYEFDMNQFQFRKVSEGMEISVQYEVRNNLVANVDLLVTFEEQVTLVH